jgi:hypothetical protein
MQAMTREPGDLPRQQHVLGRGVPVVRLAASLSRDISLHASAMAFCPQSWGHSYVFVTSYRYTRHAKDRSAA